MAILNKLSSKLEPVFRFSSWEKMGANTREVDNRTTEQLRANIEYFAKKNPEVAKFKKDLETMDKKYLGLASDICELANKQEQLPLNIDLKALKSKDNKSLFEYLLEKLPSASKENPKALDFMQEVINQTDTTASKYFMADFGKIIEVPQASKQLEATRPLIKDIAQETLNGGYTMDFSKEKSFMDVIKTLVHPDSKPEKISLISKLLGIVKKLPDDDIMYVDEFVRSDAPLNRVETNISKLAKASQQAHNEGKNINIANFLNTNV